MLYDYECSKCKKQKEINKTMAELEREEICCKLPMIHVIQTPNRFATFDTMRRASLKRVMKKKMESERKK